MHFQNFAKDWVDAWNSHDIERILNHYTEDIEITTPMIKMATGDNAGTLKGKTAVRNYWQKALEKIPDLHFEIYDVAEGIDSVAIYYKSVLNKKAIETMFLNEEGKVYKMVAFYTNN